jgi:hypothetical protein
VVVPAIFSSRFAQSHATAKDPSAMERMKSNDAGGDIAAFRHNTAP